MAVRAKEQNPRRDAANVRLPPPLVFAAMVALGWALGRWIGPSAPLDSVPPVVLRVATLSCGGFGLILVIGAMLQLSRSDQDPAPWRPTPSLLTGGVYRWSRNPIYVGMVLIQAGIGFDAGILWIVLLAPASLVLIHWTAVRHEETYLERRFGAEYLAYRGRVRRWL